MARSRSPLSTRALFAGRKRRAANLPGRLLGWDDADPHRLLLRFERVLMEISIGVHGGVRLRAGLAPALPPDPYTSLGRDPWAGLPLTVFERGGCVRIGSVARRHQGVVEVVPSEPAVRLLEAGGVGVTLEGFVFEPGGGAGVRARFGTGTCFYGFGVKTGPLDKRGRVLHMRNRDAAPRKDIDPLYAGIPFFVAADPPQGRSADAAAAATAAPPFASTPDQRPARACGVLLDGFAPSRFDVARGDAESVKMRTTAGGLDVLLLPGPSMAQVMRGFTAVVGRTSLPPLWALGYHQSRWSYDDEKTVKEVARQLRARGIPGDVIHLDIDYMDGFRVFTWDKQRFPDPVRLVRELAADGFRVVTIVDPGVKVDPGYALYADGLARGYFCCRRDGSPYALRVWPGAAVLPDFNRIEVRRWWAASHGPLLEAGVAGIWNDMNEPAGWQRDLRIGRLVIPTKEQDMREVVQADPADQTRTRAHEEVRNLYGLQQCRATRSALEKARPAERPFVLSRSGYTGIQRYAALWTGDNASRWRDLRRSIPMLLGLSLSGVAFCGADIGGFARSCTSELYARWIQLGALYPLARTHSKRPGRHQEPYRFGPRVERIARAALELRMRLMPYLYGLFLEAEETGAPVWRPLSYEFPEDADGYRIDDQFLLGPSLLVAPVVDKHARRRTVYLPPGYWTALDDGVLYQGGSEVTVDAPLRRLPIFVRTPSLLPTRSPVQHAGQKPREALILEVFAAGMPQEQPSAAAGCRVFEDDGISLAYRDGGGAHTLFRVHCSQESIVFDAAVRQGDFVIAPRPVRVVFRGAGDAVDVRCDGTPVEWLHETSLEQARARGFEGPWARPAGADLDVGYLDDGRPCQIAVHMEAIEEVPTR